MKDTVKNLIFFFLLIYPHYSAKELFQMWSDHIILREYRKPTLSDLETWHQEFINERAIFLENVTGSKNVYESEDFSI